MSKYSSLRAEIARMRKLMQAQSDIDLVAREAKSHAVPSKRQTKGVKAHEPWHLSSVRGVPGGAGKSGYSIMKMVQAETTGTRVVEGDAELTKRLSHTARNSNTTSTTTDARTRGLIR